MKATRQLLPRRPPNVLAGFVAATLISALCASALAHESRTEWILSGQVSIGQYDFRIYSKYLFKAGEEKLRLEDALIIEKTGRVVEKLVAPSIEIEPKNIASLYGARLVPIGTDMTGDGTPNILVTSYSGGAHCCYTYHIYSIGNEFRKIDELEVGDATISFLNVDEDPDLEAESADYNFVYWYTSFASTPAPRIVFKFRDDKYRIAPELMWRAPISEGVLEREALALRKNGQRERHGNQPHDPRLWGIMLDLIYTGHFERARRFLDEAWPAAWPGKEQFRHEFFDCQLRRSMYWRYVAAMNNVPAKEPLPECPPCPECG